MNRDFLLISIFVLVPLIFYFLGLHKKLAGIFLRKKESRKYAKMCPKCGSMKVKIDFSNPVVWDYGANAKYKCADCGNLSLFMLDIPLEEVENYKKELREKIRRGSVKYPAQSLFDSAPGFAIGLFGAAISSVSLAISLYAGMATGSFRPALLIFFFWSAIFLSLVILAMQRKNKPRLI